MSTETLTPEEIAAITARLSTLGEDSALNYFWVMARDGADPLMVLGWMSQVVIARPDDWNKATVRQQHERGFDTFGARISKTHCYGCQTSVKNLYHHHIIEVQNGGSNTPRNLVPLCFACHKVLHPWLTVEPKPTRGGGFVPLHDVMQGMFDRMRMRK